MSKPANWPEGIPYIDERVEHVGISTLRLMNATRLCGLSNVMVIRDNGQPLAVLMPYQTDIDMQEAK